MAQSRVAHRAPAKAANWALDTGELRSAAVVLEGYAAEAGLGEEPIDLDTVTREAAEVADDFVDEASGEVQSLIARQAERHTGWLTRIAYETALAAMLAVLLYRLGRNFFYDSWLAAEPVEVYGLNFFVAAAFWLFVWCAVLLWIFSLRLRRGLRAEINGLAQNWTSAALAGALFGQLERRVERVLGFGRQLTRVEASVAELEHRVSHIDERLGQRTAPNSAPTL